MAENSWLNLDFIVLIAVLILAISGIIYFIVFSYKQRKKSYELVITSKEELIKKINPSLLQMGYHLESDKENIITYKRYFTRIGITIDKNKAILTGPSYLVKQVIDKY
jgi:hypothetical protein